MTRTTAKKLGARADLPFCLHLRCSTFVRMRGGVVGREHCTHFRTGPSRSSILTTCPPQCPQRASGATAGAACGAGNEAAEAARLANASTSVASGRWLTACATDEYFAATRSQGLIMMNRRPPDAR